MSTPSSKPEGYKHRRDHTSATKVNYCHYVLKQLMGYLLHPKIDVETTSIRVADLGTETGVWPIDLAESLPPSATIDGFDISSLSFPPAQWLPKTVKLHTQDIFDAFPEQLLGQYDVVHLRLFLTLSKAQILLLLRNVVKLLRPGGFLQWTEHDKASVEVVAASPAASTEATQQMVALERMPFPNYEQDWLDHIAPSIAALEGLEIVAHDRISVRDSLRTQLNQLQILALSGVQPGLSPVIDDFRDRYTEMLKEEFSRGVSTAQDFICIVARKAA